MYQNGQIQYGHRQVKFYLSLTFLTLRGKYLNVMCFSRFSHIEEFNAMFRFKIKTTENAWN